MKSDFFRSFTIEYCSLWWRGLQQFSSFLEAFVEHLLYNRHSYTLWTWLNPVGTLSRFPMKPERDLDTVMDLLWCRKKWMACCPLSGLCSCSLESNVQFGDNSADGKDHASFGLCLLLLSPSQNVLAPNKPPYVWLPFSKLVGLHCQVTSVTAATFAFMSRC